MTGTVIQFKSFLAKDLRRRNVSNVSRKELRNNEFGIVIVHIFYFLNIFKFNSSGMCYYMRRIKSNGRRSREKEFKFNALSNVGTTVAEGMFSAR